MSPACSTPDREACNLRDMIHATNNCTAINQVKAPLNFSIENHSDFRWRDEWIDTCSQIYRNEAQ